MSEISFADLKNELKTELDDLVRSDEPMSAHTSFKVGGPAEIFVSVRKREDVIGACEICHRYGVIPTVIGNGSNLLVRDGGIEGVVLAISGGLDSVKFDGCEVTAEAGISLASLVAKCADHGLSGLEFAGGIPGALGGGVFMNAGAYGGELSAFLKEVTLLSLDGKIRKAKTAELDMSYRHTILEQTGEIVLDATFLLNEDEPAAIRERIGEFNRQRREKQPLNYASAGSTFKRPTGFFAGKLIQDSGLSGFGIGDACVSEKHCGFVVNKGSASAAQVLEVIEHVQQTVSEKFGVRLETEVRILGKDKL